EDYGSISRNCDQKGTCSGLGHGLAQVPSSSA
ncbi:hypothetical protein A2U01_0096397, partial [Trifolium medium]|nr:hypothetical protein [Trifolium medium]